MTAGSGTSWSSWMTGPSSRCQASGQQVGGPAYLPLVPGLTAPLSGAQESQLLAPLGPPGPLTPPQWDEDQQLGGLKELLSQLSGLLLDKGGHPRVLAEAADLGHVGKSDPRSLPTPLGPTLPPIGVGVESGLASHELPSPSLP